MRTLAVLLMVVGVLVLVLGSTGVIVLEGNAALAVKLVCIAIAAAGAVWSIERQRRRP